MNNNKTVKELMEETKAEFENLKETIERAFEKAERDINNIFFK